MTKLVRITRTLKDKGIIVPESEVQSLIEPTSAYFQSLYYYGDEVLDYFKSHKNSIKGYKGRAYTNLITFDIDSKDLEVSKQNTIILIDWLKEQGLYDEYAAKIAFSGSKGFHLTLNTAYEFEPKELKSLCMYISSQVPFIEEAGFQRVDPTIYNTTRQFRIVNTKHDKSGLYKIEMVESELRECTMEKIKLAAAEPQKTYPFESQIDDKPIRAILLQLAEDKPKSKYEAPRSGVIKTLMGAKRKKCIEIIQDGDMKDGESNSGLLRLASYYRRQGYTQEQCREKLVQAADNRKKKYPFTNDIDDAKIDQEILYSVYSTEGYIFTCQDWFLKQKCAGACENNGCVISKPKEPEVYLDVAETCEDTTSGSVIYEYRNPQEAFTQSNAIETNVEPKVVNKPVVSPFGGPSFKQNLVKHSKEDIMKLSGFRTVKQSSDSFKTFAEDWQSYRVMTGIDELDDIIRMLPTGLTIVNARPGVAKTTLLLNIAENTSRSGKATLVYSIDMAEDEFFTKSKSKALRISPDDVLDLYFNQDDEAKALQAEGDALTEAMLENVFINYDGKITPEKIDSDLTAFKEAGINIDLVIIDYLQKMEGCGDFTSPRIGHTLMGLKALQPKHKVCIIGLSQIPRGQGNLNEETPVLTAAAAKGGSVYEENASIVINLWRPMKFYRNEHGSQDKYLGYMVAKNRLGQCKEGVLYFKGATSEIRTLTADEREEYEITKEERKQREQPKVSKGFGHV